MGSPLEVMQGKKNRCHQSSANDFLALAEQTPIRVRMFLESQPFQLPKGQSALKLEVVMNPALKRIYIGFYLSLFLMMGYWAYYPSPFTRCFCRCVFSGIFCLCFDLFKKRILSRRFLMASGADQF